MTHIGSKIKSKRIMNGLSLQDLSDKIGISKQALSKIEIGKCNPSQETLIKIKEALGIKLDTFSRKQDIGEFKIIHISYSKR